ncbi:low affinity iron permease family protein [Chroococcidiopsis sp.]|uniref:low affinity iron permease family protein n=1 Tax=Chroococcidiopsis sp. TaxID=3088168 RepID=UPI003F2D4DB4
MNEFFRKFATKSAQAMGTPWAFLAALASVIVWATSGPYFKWSEAHQLAINTGTTVITYLMVFLVQASQNRDSKAIQTKLNAILAAQEGASNKLIDLENQAESELDSAVEEIKSMRDD